MEYVFLIPFIFYNYRIGLTFFFNIAERLEKKEIYITYSYMYTYNINI